MSLTVGARVGPYEVVSLLGAGGMGQVYRARDARLGRDVALKVLPVGEGLDPDRLRRFEQEARAAGVLSHPNVLTVHDVGVEDGRPYLITELLEGETLRERLARGALGAGRAVDLAAQAALGLAAAHAKGVVHRDLKPENLFVTRDGRLKILDFGIAKLLQGDGASVDALATAPGTLAGVVIGTAAYMAPEQVAARSVDGRADIFSLGIVLHEMLSGRGPFARSTTIEAMTAVLHDDPPPLPDAAGVPVGVERIVQRCLEKSPDERFQSARDLAFALQALTLSTGSVRQIEAPKAAGRRPGVYVPWWAVLAIAFGASAALWVAARSQSKPSGPQFGRVIKLAATDAIESSPVLSPDGKWIAYLSDEGGRMNVWVRFLSGGQPVNLTANAPELFVSAVREIGGLDISPDGSEIAFEAGTDARQLPSNSSTYAIAAPLGGPARKLVNRGMGLRWSPDGQRIAYVLPGGVRGDAIAVADRTGENERVVLPVTGGLHAHWLAWSPDGRYLYYNRSGTSGNFEPSEIFRVPTNGGPEERVIATSRRASFPFPLRDGLLYSANPSSVDLALWWKPWNGQPTPLTTGVGEYAEARLSPDGKRMVATVYQPRRALWTIPTAETTPTPVLLMQSASGDSDPAWSPNGDRIAFSSTRSGGRNIWTAKPDGSGLRQLTAGNEIDDRPQWSPDGARLAFISSRGGQRGIWVVAADGGAPRRVLNARVLNTIAWSPDGREITYSAPAGDAPAIFRVPVEGGTPLRIQSGGAASSPAWSLANGLIAYVASAVPKNGAPGRTWPALMQGSGERVALPDQPTLANGFVAWSPDGRWLAGVSSPGNGDASIWIFPVDGHVPPRQLIQFGSESRPWGLTWSPDGQRLVFGLHERTADVVLFDSES